jgi:DNA-binding SARP family transcriptional activator/streptogramin lyase
MEFRILGPLEIVDDGRDVPLSGAKQRALLALLLLHANRVVSRDRLIDELWDTSPPETARTALQVHVSQLRKALGRERIVTQSPGYLVRVEPDELDLERFEHLLRGVERADSAGTAEALREALALWRGPPLGDLDGSFASAERARLDEQRLLALEQRIEAELALGVHAELVPELEELVRENLLRERLRAQLMLALYRCGRQAEALEVYRNGRRLLAEELGLEPGDDLRRLEKAILEQDPSLAAPEAPAAATPLGAPASRRLRLRLLALVVGTLVLVGALATGIVVATRGSGTIVVRPNSVAALSAKTGKVVADVPIGGSPVALDLGAGAAWAVDADHSTITRIDLKTKEALPIGGLGSQVSDVVFAFGSLWVAGGNDGTLARIDPRHNGIQQVELGRAGKGVPQPVFTVRAGAGAVWVTRGNQLLRVSPSENAVTARLRVNRPQGVDIGLGSAWVTTEDERVLRIDARRAKPTYSQDLSRQMFFPLVDHGSLWLIVTDLVRYKPQIWRLDPGTLSQEAAITFPNAFPYGLAAGSGAVWAVDPERGSIWRIDPRTNRAKLLAKVPHHPVAVAVGDGIVWVGVQAEPL